MKKEAEWRQFIKDNEPNTVSLKILNVQVRNTPEAIELAKEMQKVFEEEMEKITPKPIDQQMPRYEVDTPLIDPEAEKEWKNRKDK